MPKAASVQQAQKVKAGPNTQTVDFAHAEHVTVPVERGRMSADKRRRESKRLKEEISRHKLENAVKIMHEGVPQVF